MQPSQVETGLISYKKRFRLMRFSSFPLPVIRLCLGIFTETRGIMKIGVTSNDGPMENLTVQLKHIRKRFKEDALTAEDVDAALAMAESASTGPRQSLLYLQAPSTNPHSAVVGISIYEDGTDPDGLDETGAFRYRSIKDALNDGWRIIKFPDMSLAMNEQDTYGLGYEFVLERWR